MLKSKINYERASSQSCRIASVILRFASSMDRHDPAVTLGTVLELSALALTSVIGPVPACVGRSSAQVQLAPLVVMCMLWRLRREEDIVRAEIDGFFRAQRGVVHHREECDQPWPTWVLGSHCLQERSRLPRVDDAAPVHLTRDLRRCPFEYPDGVVLEQSQLDGVG